MDESTKILRKWQRIPSGVRVFAARSWLSVPTRHVRGRVPDGRQLGGFRRHGPGAARRLVRSRRRPTRRVGRAPPHDSRGLVRLPGGTPRGILPGGLRRGCAGGQDCGCGRGCGHRRRRHALGEHQDVSHETAQGDVGQTTDRVEEPRPRPLARGEERHDEEDETDHGPEPEQQRCGDGELWRVTGLRADQHAGERENGQHERVDQSVQPTHTAQHVRQRVRVQVGRDPTGGDCDPDEHDDDRHDRGRLSECLDPIDHAYVSPAVRITVATSFFTSSARSLAQTSVMSPAVTTTVSFSPTTATKAWSPPRLRMTLPTLSRVTTCPSTALPSCCSRCSARAGYPPTSYHSIGSLTATTCAVASPLETGSMTAKSTLFLGSVG